MKVESTLNGVPLKKLSEEEWKKFANQAQKQMLKIAGYKPIDN